MSLNTPTQARRRNEQGDGKLKCNPNVVEQRIDEDEKRRLKAKDRSVEKMSSRAILALVSSCVYLGYRMKCIVDAQSKVSGYDATVAWVYMAVEIGIACEYPIARVKGRLHKLETSPEGAPASEKLHIHWELGCLRFLSLPIEKRES